MIEWVVSVSVTSLLCGLIYLVLPKGKVSAAIKTVVSLVAVFALIKPLAGVDFSGLSEDGFFGNKEVSVQEDYLDYVFGLRDVFWKKEITAEAEKMGIKLKAENIYIISEGLSEKGFSVSGARISLKDAVIITENEHIDIIEEIKKIASGVLQVDTGKIVVIYD